MSSLKKDLVSGVFYTSLAKYASYVVQLVVTAILARLLTPEDYGVVAVATVFIAFFSLLSNIGIGPAIIQYKELTKNDLNSIFSFTAYVGVVMSLLFYISSWFIANYYENDTLVPVCQILSLTILFNCLIIVPLNIQYRDKNFKYAAIASLSTHIGTAIIAIVLALLDFGVYALVFQQVLSAVFLFLLFYAKDRLRFKFKVDGSSLKKIMSFSIYQFLFNLINYFARNLDKLLVGRFIGMAPLGQYEKSYRLMMLPLQNLTFAITPVMQPVFSTMQNDLQLMAEKYKKLFSLLCYIGFPLSVLLFFSGKELILLFFGDQWTDAILPFRILALSVGLQMLNGTTGSIYQSANATKQLFISGCWCSLFMISSFVITIAGWGTIVAVSIGYVIAQLFNSALAYYLLFKTIHYPLSRILPVAIYPLLISLVIGGCLLVSYPFFDNFPLLVSLIGKCIIALSVLLLCVNFAGPYKGLVNKVGEDLLYKIKKVN